MKISHIFTYDIRPGRLFDIPGQPVNVMLDITNDCNNRCVFCYNPASESYRRNTPDFDILKRIIIKIAKADTKELLYLGGEPFVFPDIKSLLSIGKEFGIFQRAVSNGSYFRSIGKCRELKNCGLDETGISLHSSKDAIHDRISGRQGAFKDALAGIETCLEAGIRVFIQYSPNILNKPFDIVDLSEILTLRFGNAVGMIDINRLLPIGHGANAENIFLKGDHWFDFLISAAELPNHGYEVRAELTPFCWIANKARQRETSEKSLRNLFLMNRGCYMWVAQLALDLYGRIKFCPAGPPVGPSILDIEWPEFWKKGGALETYRNFVWNKKCVDFETNVACKYFYRCLGGCKYSKGVHYGVDEYSFGMRFFEKNSEGRTEGFH